MTKTFLFSPVGGTDPISASNFKDGSLLHICRCYRPDIVYLYMSKEILEFQKKDGRYTYCLDRLGEKIEHKIEYKIIERPDVEKVQEFDFFYQEFRSIISDIQKEKAEDDRLLLNISSGTPAMKSALLVLKTLGEFTCDAIQVITPENSMNQHDGHKDHENQDIEILWELDEDNNDDFINRCIVVKCPTLTQIQQEGYIKKLIREYDYAAAYELAKMMPSEVTEGYIDLLLMASQRLLMNESEVDKILGTDKRYALPIHDSNVRKYFEYALTLKIKLEKKEYADFIRGITPLLWDLFEKILAKQAKIKLEDYCSESKGALKWDETKMKGTMVLQILKGNINDNEFHYCDVTSYHLNELIKNLDVPSEVKQVVDDLRRVESKLRNIAAHQIFSVTAETISRRTGFTGKQIMDKICKAFIYAGIKVRSDDWNSYDHMNKVIIDAMPQ